jgi:hypothetical protein
LGKGEFKSKNEGVQIHINLILLIFSSKKFSAAEKVLITGGGAILYTVTGGLAAKPIGKAIESAPRKYIGEANLEVILTDRLDGTKIVSKQIKKSSEFAISGRQLRDEKGNNYNKIINTCLMESLVEITALISDSLSEDKNFSKLIILKKTEIDSGVVKKPPDLPQKRIDSNEVLEKTKIPIQEEEAPQKPLSTASLKNFLTGKVTSLHGDVIELDIGSSEGVKVGHTGRVYYIVTIDGKEKPIYIAKFKITHLSQKSSMAQIEDKTAEIKIGHSIEINAKTER